MMLSMGYAKPLEDLASRTTFGKSKNGVGLQFLVQIPVLKHLGLCLGFDHTFFYVDEEELYKRNGTYTSPYVSGEISSVSVNQSWVMSVLNVGGFTNLPLSQDRTLSLDVRFMFGSCLLRSPDISCTYATFSPTTMAVSYQTESVSGSKSSNYPITFSFGMGLRYDLDQDWCLALVFDYLNVLKETELTDIQATNTVKQTSTYQKKLDLCYCTIKFGIGRFF